MLNTRTGGGVIAAPIAEKEDSMLVKITRSTVAGKQQANVGDELDLPQSEARYLINIGKATRVAPVAPDANENEQPSTEAAPTPAPAKSKKVK